MQLSGVSKLALRAEYFDPTVVREGVVLSFFEAMGVCTQRKSYAVLTINGVYMGLYLQTELIETDWLEARFPDALPLLYKTNVWTGEYQGEHQLFSPAFELYTKYVNGGKSPIKVPTWSLRVICLFAPLCVGVCTFVSPPPSPLPTSDP